MIDNSVVLDILQQHPYPLVFATGTGSHVFGCASPQSDLDIHGVHLLPLSHALGLQSETGGTIERRVEHPTKLEIVTHDLRKFIKLLIKGNGNILEALYSPRVFESSPVHTRLQELGRGCITKRCAAHYQGMAQNQQRNLKNNEVKKLLHMYRCLLMGIHLMRTGRVEMHLPTLAEWYHHEQVYDVIICKTTGQRILAEEAVRRHIALIERLKSQLEETADESSLPDYTSAETWDALEQVLIDTRLGGR